MQSYQPGLHILLKLKANRHDRLLDCAEWEKALCSILADFSIEVVGQARFVFENQGFTSTFCLKESHICIHTWPEFGILTFDVFLCNYSRDNSTAVRAIVQQQKDYFEATVIEEFELTR